MSVRLEPDGSTPAEGTLAAPSKPVRDANRKGCVTGPCRGDGSPQPATVLTGPSVSRRVPVAVIAGVEWVRLMERP